MSQRFPGTAGASAIGLAVAQAFADSGAPAWVADMDREALPRCPGG